MATPNYDVNYEDKRFKEVESEENSALKKSDAMYDGMISDAGEYYNEQIEASKDWAKTQKKNQQAQTDFAIEQINQQKDQAKKDYTKEQSGAYTDWQKQSGAFGANAEQMASQGLQRSGFSESSQVSMYNTYQARVVAAREAYQRAVLNYDNAIKDARLQNNSALAEIAYQALQTQLELSLQGFQYKNTLVLAKADARNALSQQYEQKYQNVLAQINKENALAEEVRQYNETMKFNQEQFDWQKAQAVKTATRKGTTKTTSGGGTANKGKATGTNKEVSKLKDNAGTGNKGTKKSEPTVDMDSVIALGYGPISGAKLDNLIRKGIVEEYESGGKLKYRKVKNEPTSWHSIPAK